MEWKGRLIKVPKSLKTKRLIVGSNEECTCLVPASAKEGFLGKNG